MVTDSTTEAVKPPSLLKRSIFNKPSWSNPKQIGNADDFFHRSNQTYVDIVAESERKRKLKLARKQNTQTQVKPLEGRAEKRRRTSEASDDDGNSSSSDEDVPRKTKGKANEGRSETPLIPTAAPISPTLPKATESLTKSYELSIAVEKLYQERRNQPSVVIDLEDEDEEPVLHQEGDAHPITTQRILRPPEEDDFPPSDEEFPELARKARDKARRKRLEADIASQAPDPALTGVGDGPLHPSQSISHPAPPPIPTDAVIQILITSRLPGTEPLIVGRRLSQRLKDVRIVWCQRQNFPPEVTPTVFLTWKGKRLFDVTTCKSLGIGVDEYGNILLKGQKDIMGEEDRQIHMEAMTEELLEEYKKFKRSGITEDKQHEPEAKEEAPAEQKRGPQVRLILKAKDFQDFKLIAKPVIFTYWLPTL